MNFRRWTKWDTAIAWWDVFAGIVVFLFFLWVFARGGQFIAEWITDWREAQ